MADDWRPRKVDLGVVNGRCFTFASGLGLDASVVERVDANPRLKARLGPYFFTWVGRHARSPAATCCSPPRLQRATPAASARRRHRDRPERLALHLLPGPPDRDRRGRALDSGTLAGGVLHRATPLDMPSIAWRAFSRRARVSAPPPGQRALPTPTELTVRSADGAPAAAAGRRRLPRRGRRGALLDPAPGADRRLLSAGQGRCG